jgi:hypothetical protein
MNKLSLVITISLFALAFNAQIKAQETKAPPAQNNQQFEEWSDDFSRDKLDESKWEKFTFEGGSGGKLEVGDGIVKIRSASKTRAGIRTKKSFAGERWIVEAHLAKVGAALPEAGSNGQALGFAAVTILSIARGEIASNGF